MYKIRYIKPSDITQALHVFEETEIDVPDDAAAIAALDAAVATPVEGSVAMDVVSGEAFTWNILKSVKL